MATLSLTNSNLEFEIKERNSLFYSKYKYCVSFNLLEVSALRYGFDADSIREAIHIRNGNRAQHRLWGGPPMGPIPINVTDDIIDLGILLGLEKDFKIVFSFDLAYVYTNDINFIVKISQLKYVKNLKYSQAEVTVASGTIQRRCRDYQKRSYFYWRKFDEKQKQSLTNFLKTNSTNGDLKMSPALRYWSGAIKSFVTQEHFFIDYNDDRLLTMLALIKPKLIRKTLKIVAK